MTKRYFLLALGLGLLPGRILAQGEGAHTYLPAPVGTNVIVPTYMDISSNYNFTQSIQINNADIRSQIGVVSYVHFFRVWGQLAELWVSPIFGSVSGTVDLPTPGGGTRTVNVRPHSGFADPYLGFRVGLFGAPGLEPAEFMKHQQTFQVYGLVGVMPPLGSYDSTRLINLGTNRWALRLGVPIVVPFGNPKDPFWLEANPNVYLYTDNTDVSGPGTVRSQDPLWVLETHLSHNLSRMFWLSFDLRGQYGGATTTDGISDDNKTEQLGGGGTLGIQLSRPLGLQVTYGTIFAKSGNARGNMWRARMTYAF
jgi:Putative MetA-pathway of phenol degradation